MQEGSSKRASTPDSYFRPNVAKSHMHMQMHARASADCSSTDSSLAHSLISRSSHLSLMPSQVVELVGARCAKPSDLQADMERSPIKVSHYQFLSLVSCACDRLILGAEPRLECCVIVMDFWVFYYSSRMNSPCMFFWLAMESIERMSGSNSELLLLLHRCDEATTATT